MRRTRAFQITTCPRAPLVEEAEPSPPEEAAGDVVLGAQATHNFEHTVCKRYDPCEECKR